MGIDYASHPFRAWRGRTPGGAEVWLLGDDRFYGREGIYNDVEGEPFADEIERLVFFAKGALELAKCMEWRPRIVHANDYQTALSLAYVRELYAHEDAFRGAGLVYSIHNLAYQGNFDRKVRHALAIDSLAFHMKGLEFHGHLMRVTICN